MKESTTPRPSTPALCLISVSYEVQGEKILDGLDLEVQSGEIAAVMGRSGCGKTTLLKLIMGLIRPSGGQIWVEGEEIGRLGEQALLRVRAKMGLVFQNAALFDSLTVAENVGFGLRERGGLGETEISARVQEELALVGMQGTERLLPGELSGGMRKRVGVARALAMQPRIMLYDEPTAGLDPPAAASLNDLIVSLRDRLGVTTVIVSHDVHSLSQVADRAAVLERGRIIAAGPFWLLAESDLPEVKSFFFTGKEKGE